MLDQTWQVDGSGRALPDLEGGVTNSEISPGNANYTPGQQSIPIWPTNWPISAPEVRISRPVKIERDMHTITIKGFRTLGLASTFIAGVEAQFFGTIAAIDTQDDIILQTSSGFLLVGILFSSFGAIAAFLSARWFELLNAEEVGWLEHRWAYARRETDKPIPWVQSLRVRYRVRNWFVAKSLMLPFYMILFGGIFFVAGVVLYTWATQPRLISVLCTVVTGPAQALSVQSYHNDSPPFIGTNEGSLEHREVPHLDLSLGPERPASRTSSQANIKLPVEQGLSRSRLQFSRATSAFGASVPGSPEEKEFANSLPNGSYETDAEPSPPRAPTPFRTDLDPSSYHFPRHRLNTQMADEGKIPLVIVACGSYSPPTYLHLRMFEMAKDAIVEKAKYEIIGGYYSPVSDQYNKPGLAPAVHRVRMCELAVDQTSNWLMVDPWEASQPEYQRTAVVLEHFDHELNQGPNGGVQMRDGSRRKVKIVLLAGGDLIESFGAPGVWAPQDLHVILGRFGCLIIERTGSDVWAFLLSHDILYHHRKNVIVVKQLIYNDISSTKVRLFVRRGMSIKYLLPNSVIQYIEDNRLYRGDEIDFAMSEVQLK
ncbi:cytidylyltransferase domain-containing protein [Rhizoctonia solani]|uniref:Cytidylyltransferase domain-containing protein n=1 Tax=Rhizoctonia solani TaxID=456999 RepID=A0A8H8SXJ9_9AGAM|nr:cytidylyltransferase domain-containing protein [Rhizoctonia solani]QRW21464.1 cytidylyltransferase domain-containing protein [Rhizoctonia solani]